MRKNTSTKQKRSNNVKCNKKKRKQQKENNNEQKKRHNDKTQRNQQRTRTDIYLLNYDILKVSKIRNFNIRLGYPDTATNKIGPRAEVPKNRPQPPKRATAGKDQSTDAKMGANI